LLKNERRGGGKKRREGGREGGREEERERERERERQKKKNVRVVTIVNGDEANHP